MQSEACSLLPVLHLFALADVVETVWINTIQANTQIQLTAAFCRVGLARVFISLFQKDIHINKQLWWFSWKEYNREEKIKFLQCQMPRIQTVMRSGSELLGHYGSATSPLYTQQYWCFPFRNSESNLFLVFLLILRWKLPCCLPEHASVLFDMGK